MSEHSYTILESWHKSENDISVYGGTLGLHHPIYQHIDKINDPDYTDNYKYLKDSYVLYYYHNQNQVLSLLRDIIGGLPLYYTIIDNHLYVANSITKILDCTSVSHAPDKKYKTDYICRSFSKNDYTYYKHIKILPAGHLLLWSQGKLEIRPQLSWQVEEQTLYDNRPDYISYLQGLMEESIYHQVKDKKKVAVEFSGGLDSTSITGVLQHLRETRLPDLEIYTYSHAQSLTPLYNEIDDERDLIEISRKAMGIDPNYHVILDRQDKSMRALYMHAYRLGNCISKSHYAIYSKSIYEQAQKDGIDLILSGFGGDQIISTRKVKLRPNINTQSLKEYLKTTSRQGIRYGMDRSYIFRKLYGYVRKRILMAKKKPIIDIRASYGQIWPDLKGYLDPVLQSIQPQLGQQTQKNIKHLMRYDLLRMGLMERLEATYHAAEHYGVRYAYPLLDPRLVQTVLEMPMDYVTGYHKRKLFRDIISKWLPPIVYNRIKRGTDMYGWVMDNYYYDYLHNIPYDRTDMDAEQLFYIEVEEMFDRPLWKSFDKEKV